MVGINSTCHKANRKILDQLHGEVIECKSHDECVDNMYRAMFDSDYLHCLESSGLPSHDVGLKRDAVIVLIRNLNISGGHCNGSRYIFWK